MTDQKPKSPELEEIVTKAKELFTSIGKGFSKLIADFTKKAPKSQEPEHPKHHKSDDEHDKVTPPAPQPQKPTEPVTPPVPPKKEEPVVTKEPKETPNKNNDKPE